MDRPDFDPRKVGGVPDEEITTRIDIRPYLSHKMQALRCHRSQIAPTWWFLRLPPDAQYEKFSQECFVLVASHVPVCLPETDLFLGLC